MKDAEKKKTMKILFVDDDDLIRNSMAYYFRHKVALFTALESAEEALEDIKKEKYDIVVCDYKLSGMNGIRFFEKLGVDYPDIKRILITAYANEKIEDKAHRIAVEAFLPKPLDTEKIKQVLLK